MPAPLPVPPTLQPERLLGRLNALAALTDPERPYTRRAFTGRYLEGREWLRQEMGAAGLTVTLDAGGNLIGTREGSQPGLGSLMLGSHTDTVVGGGRFDGILGVLAALEVAHSLKDAGLTLRHPLEVVDFLSEEPSDYGASCVGSRALAGTLTPALLDGKNSAGETLREAMTRMGARPDELSAPLRAPGDIAAFLELHIEQGPVLERAGLEGGGPVVGVVDGIVGIERHELTFVGRPDHAGTTPMTLRQDALLAAARFVDGLDALAQAAHREAPLVATVGQLRVSPGNSNVVPGEAVLVFEARALDSGRLERFVAAALELAQTQAERGGVHLSHRAVSRAAPLHCAPPLQAALVAAAEGLGLPWLPLPSGAGHDAMQVGRLAPAGMLFVASVGGRSHTPDELTHEADLIAGAEVLLGAVLHLDRTLSAPPEAASQGDL